MVSINIPDPRKRILFICTHNSTRSQMSEGLMNSRMGDRFEAHSAGTHPRGVNTNAITVMEEMGIDISKNRSKGLEEFNGWDFDFVVTVCSDAAETCPFFPGKEHVHKGFEDPSQKPGSDEVVLGEFRRIRDEIWNWMKDSF